jgi:hypothetical protein
MDRGAMAGSRRLSWDFMGVIDIFTSCLYELSLKEKL